MSAHAVRRKHLIAVTVVASGTLLLTAACGGISQAATDHSPTRVTADVGDAPDAQITITPRDGARNVGINRDTRVTVTHGTLTEVTLTAATGGPKIAGTISPDGTSWAPSTTLKRGTDYKLTAKAKDGRGRLATSNSHFTTVSAAHSFLGHFQPNIEGKTVGAGMYPSIQFDKPVENKAAVESKITVNASSGQPVVGHWFGDNRLDLRPQHEFAPGTTVTLYLDLEGVQASTGVYGVQDREVSYTVGRSQVSTVDIAAKKMTVTRDGKVIKTLPISAGSADNPTYNGTMTISEKYRETRMDGSTVGFKDKKGASEYDIPDVPHAMRLSRSGTFVHGNYWSTPASTFGKVNVSHGCIGLADAQGADDPETDGAWFYANSLIGDQIVVKNSPDKTITADNGLSGWNMDWAQWTAGSALS